MTIVKQRYTGEYVRLDGAFVGTASDFNKSVVAPIGVERIRHQPVRRVGRIVDAPADDTDGVVEDQMAFGVLVNSCNVRDR